MDTTKWIKLTGFKHQAWANGKPTTKLEKQREVYVNPALILSIYEEKEEAHINLLVQIPEQIGSKVVAANGFSYEDVRPPKELIEAISKL